MVHLPYLQPFEDGNKRVSRLGANIPLVRHNMCPLSFVDVAERAYIAGLLGVYELNRVELTAAAMDRVPAEHLDDFVRMAVRELDNLHEGNYVRFRLRPSEYQAWRDSLHARDNT